jgi:hypothetical protein
LAADRSSILIIAIVTLTMGVAAMVLLKRSGDDRQLPPALTPEARVYLKNLQLSEVQMQANESYLKQAVVEIEGKITNNGDKVLKLVEINCVFRDNYGQVVLRERMAIAGRKMGDLAPGETKAFRLAFDSIPESWSKVMPDLVIAQIVFV